MTEIDFVNLIRELGVAGALVYVLLRHVVPALDKIAGAIAAYRASNDAQHAATQAAVAKLEGTIRSRVNGVGLILAALCLLFVGCVDYHHHVRAIQDDLRVVRARSAPGVSPVTGAPVTTSSYVAAWDALEDHVQELEAVTR